MKFYDRIAFCKYDDLSQFCLKVVSFTIIILILFMFITTGLIRNKQLKKIKNEIAYFDDDTGKLVFVNEEYNQLYKNIRE